jgi:hypothetical protein
MLFRPKLLKSAVTEVELVNVMLQEEVPEQAPDQPEKAVVGVGVSLRVILVFSGKLAEHVVGQLIPAGVLVTVPLPEAETVNVTIFGAELGGGVCPMVTLLPPPHPERKRKPKTLNDNSEENQRDCMKGLLRTFDEGSREVVV